MNQAGTAGDGAVSGLFSEIGRCDVFSTVLIIVPEKLRESANSLECSANRSTRGLSVGILLPMFTRSKANFDFGLISTTMFYDFTRLLSSSFATCDFGHPGWNVRNEVYTGWSPNIFNLRP